MKVTDFLITPVISRAWIYLSIFSLISIPLYFVLLGGGMNPSAYILLDEVGMFIPILFGCLAVACMFNYLFSSIRALMVTEAKRTAESAFAESRKPSVGFPFEPIKDLVEEASKVFSKYPFETLPQVLISPAHFFPLGKDAFFHGVGNTIYLKDSYVNEASPEALAQLIQEQVLHAWLWAYRNQVTADGYMNRSGYDATYSAMAKTLGIEKQTAHHTVGV